MFEVIESEKFRMMSNSDLLAIILGKEKTVEVEKGADMLFEPNGLYCSACELAEKTNLSSYNANRLLAISELLKRKRKSKERVKVTSAQDVFDYVHEDFQNLDHEELFVLFVDNGSYVIKQVRFSVGTYANTSFDVRQILRTALELKAIGMILQHNHPSGSTEASPQDYTITRVLCAAGKVLQIPVIDHIIVGKGGYTSLCRENPEMFEKSL